MQTIINTIDAPQPIGPYSQAVRAGNFLYLSGQIAINPDSGELILENITKETHQVMKNIGAVLVEAGVSFGQIVKSSIFLKRMSDFNEVNEVYSNYFSSNFPARETVEVSCLPKNVNVEISVTVYIA